MNCEHDYKGYTDLQIAYMKAAKVFLETILQGDPEHIVPKIKKCPIIKDFGFSCGGHFLWYKSLGHINTSSSGLHLPLGIKIVETVTKTYKVERA